MSEVILTRVENKLFNRVKALLSNGWLQKDIAKELKIHQPTVSEITKLIIESGELDHLVRYNTSSKFCAKASLLRLKLKILLKQGNTLITSAKKLKITEAYARSLLKDLLTNGLITIEEANTGNRIITEVYDGFDQGVLEKLKQGIPPFKIIRDGKLKHYDVKRSIDRLIEKGLVEKYTTMKEYYDKLVLDNFEKCSKTRELAELIGLSVDSTQRKIRRLKQEGYDIQFKKTVKPTFVKANKKRELIQSLLDQGYSAKEIASQMGISLGLVYDRLKELKNK